MNRIMCVECGKSEADPGTTLCIYCTTDLPKGPNMTPYAIWDLDNCLADDGWRIPHIDWGQSDLNERYRPYHERCGSDMFVHAEVFHSVSLVAAPVFFTARPEAVREVTVGWLEAHCVKWPMLYMRANSDHCPSAVVKERMLVEFRRRGNRPIVAFDDVQTTVDMYLRNGVPARVLKIHDRCAFTPPPERKWP